MHWKLDNIITYCLCRLNSSFCWCSNNNSFKLLCFGGVSHNFAVTSRLIFILILVLNIDCHAYFSVAHFLNPNLGDSQRFPGNTSIVFPIVITNRGSMAVYWPADVFLPMLPNHSYVYLVIFQILVQLNRGKTYF